MIAPTFTVDLPLPPSTNALFANRKGGGRVKAEAYRAWLNEARWHLIMAWRAAGKPVWPDKTPMRIALRLGITGRRLDASNLIKAIEDVLVKELPVPDDRWNDAGEWLRDETIPGVARVTIAPLEPG